VSLQRFWLFKSEPLRYSFQDLLREGSTGWDGVRNYQARNFLRDEVCCGDGVLFYHSRTKPLSIPGTAIVTKAGHPDPTQFDSCSRAFDPKSLAENPRWFQVRIAPVAPFDPPITREELRGVGALKDMRVLAKGSRLSVQPVSRTEWELVLALRPELGKWRS